MRSCTGMPCARVLQHMATLAGTEACRKPPRASHKRRVPRACQLLHSGEECPKERMHRSSQIQLTERRGPMCPCSAESVSLDASIGPHDGAREASGAAAGMTEPNPAVPAGYPLDLSLLLEAILQMHDS